MELSMFSMWDLDEAGVSEFVQRRLQQVFQFNTVSIGQLLHRLVPETDLDLVAERGEGFNLGFVLRKREE
jgi:hypothetical protein